MATNRPERLTQLLQFIDSKKIAKTIVRNPQFADEPPIYSYASSLNTDLKPKVENLTSGGVSFFSPKTALLKCAGEAIERYCWYKFESASEIMSSYSELKPKALNPSLVNSKFTNNQKLIWIKAYNLTKKSPSYVPRQLVNFFNAAHKSEYSLSQPSITTGCAGGFDKQSALLRGTYETIERDAFMSIYLTKTKAPLIDIERVSSLRLQYIIESCRRYKLEPFVFDITTDLRVPVFLAVLVDRTGKGPAISCGAKCGLNMEKALTDSIEEAFLSRTWIREMLIEKSYQRNNDNIDNIRKRALYWSHPFSIGYLDFLLNQKREKLDIKRTLLNISQQLNLTLSLLSAKGHEAYCINLGEKILSSNLYFVYRVIIPSLQPLYLVESEKKYSIREKRLQQISDFFGTDKYDINTVPHPFL